VDPRGLRSDPGASPCGRLKGVGTTTPTERRKIAADQGEGALEGRSAGRASPVHQTHGGPDAREVSASMSLAVFYNAARRSTSHQPMRRRTVCVHRRRFDVLTRPELPQRRRPDEGEGQLYGPAKAAVPARILQINRSNEYISSLFAFFEALSLTPPTR